MLLLLFFLFLDGVCGADTDGMISVTEGDSVTLRTDLTELLNDDTILWKFGPDGTLISHITRENDLTSLSYGTDVRFRGRAQVDENTGSLTIRNTRERHSGQYQLTISRGSTSLPLKTFNVTVQRVKTDEVKSVSVMEGEPVTLDPNNTQILGDDLLLWFGDKGILLARIDGETKAMSLTDADEGFRDRLKLDQTGSLTITNTRTTDSGLYQLQIRGSDRLQQFILTVNRQSSGVSPGAVAGIVVLLVILAAAVAVGVMYYLLSEQRKRILTAPVEVKEGEDVTLKSNIKIKKDDHILWLFGGDELKTGIAEIRTKPRQIITPGNAADGRFRDRLKLDETTGSLTITDTRTEHSGLYTIHITSSSGETSQQIFTVTVRARLVVVNEGQPVTLKTGLTKLQTDEEIQWRFGKENSLIAGIKGETREKAPDVPDERFRDRLQLNEKTGDLTIRKSTAEDAGRYKLKIRSSKGDTYGTYTVVIIERTSLTENIDSSGKRGNESATVVMSLLDK